MHETHSGTVRTKSMRFKFLLCVLIPALTAISVFGKPKNDKPKSEIQLRAEALMNRAHQVSDIRSKNAPPFRLNATFTFIGKNLETVHGTYTEIWVSPEQWRRETVVNGARWIAIGGDHRHWTADGGKDFPEVARQIPGIMNLFPNNEVPLDFKTISEKGNEKAIADCAITKPGPLKEKSAFCFDKNTGVLLESVYPEIRLGNFVAVSCGFGEFQKFGEFLFPHNMACTEQNHLKVEARVVDLTFEPSPDANLFKPPPGAIEQKNCDGPVRPPVAVSTASPEYPSSDRNSAIATLSVVIETDGKPRDLEIIESTSPEFEGPALAALRRWKFRPATCFGQPISVKIAVEMEFHR